MFIHLELHARTKQSIDQLVKNLSKPEIIEGFKCSKCKRETKHTKTSYIYSIPKYLILHIKRFEVGYYSAKKISTTVELDNQLKIEYYNGEETLNL